MNIWEHFASSSRKPVKGGIHVVAMIYYHSRIDADLCVNVFQTITIFPEKDSGGIIHIFNSIQRIYPHNITACFIFAIKACFCQTDKLWSPYGRDTNNRRLRRSELPGAHHLHRVFKSRPLVKTCGGPLEALFCNRRGRQTNITPDACRARILGWHRNGVSVGLCRISHNQPHNIMAQP